MNLTEWRRSIAPVEVTLPSTLEVKLKPVSLQGLVANGRVPLHLMQTVMKELGKSEDGKIDPETAVEQAETLSTLMRNIARECLVEVLDEEGYVKVSTLDFDLIVELSLEDLSAIMNWASREVKPLEKFREEPGADIEPAPAG